MNEATQQFVNSNSMSRSNEVVNAEDDSKKASTNSNHGSAYNISSFNGIESNPENKEFLVKSKQRELKELKDLLEASEKKVADLKQRIGNAEAELEELLKKD